MTSTNDNRTTELLPCPFCGGNAKITAWTPMAVSVSCIMCGAHFNTYNKAEAIAAWNQRHMETCESVNTDGYGFRFECSKCGYSTIVHNCAVRFDELPNFCPNCGRKVVDNADE